MSASTGKITAIHGVVVECKFEGEVPSIYEAVEITEKNSI
jgi:F0F1-type ATP synthase beta subunit